MPSMSVWFVARAAHSTRSATVPVPASSATVTPVAHAIATSSGIFAVRCPEMTRDKVGCEMPVMSASARWLRPAAARARSILTPTPVVFTATSQQPESQSAYVIQHTRKLAAPLPQTASLVPAPAPPGMRSARAVTSDRRPAPTAGLRTGCLPALPDEVGAEMVTDAWAHQAPARPAKTYRAEHANLPRRGL
jgi:hypothetical protein